MRCNKECGYRTPYGYCGVTTCCNLVTTTAQPSHFSEVKKMRLIDADALVERIIAKVRDTSFFSMIMAEISNVIASLPTVDAEPIRHGHWEYNPKDAFEVMFKLPKCSVCGHESSDALKYCSNCGALMDEVKE